MRRRQRSFKDLALAILERVAELWARWFLHLVALPALNHGLRTREDVDAAERHLFRTDAHISRAIYKTARRLAGLPSIRCPMENFYRPPLKSPRHIRWLYLNCVHKLQHARRLAIRMAWRWRRDTEIKARDPLCDLRGGLDTPTSAFLPQSRSGWWSSAQRQDGGCGPVGPLGARAPPLRHSTPQNTSPAPCWSTSEVAGVCACGSDQSFVSVVSVSVAVDGSGLRVFATPVITPSPSSTRPITASHWLPTPRMLAANMMPIDSTMKPMR